MRVAHDGARHLSQSHRSPTRRESPPTPTPTPTHPTPHTLCVTGPPRMAPAPRPTSRVHHKVAEVAVHTSSSEQRPNPAPSKRIHAALRGSSRGTWRQVARLRYETARGVGSPPCTALRACRVPCQEQESPTCAPDRPFKILLVQVGTLSSSPIPRLGCLGALGVQSSASHPGP